jgi:hypothetical protein
LCSLWLLIGLLLLTIGVEVNISTAFTWSACKSPTIEVDTYRFNILLCICLLFVVVL